MDCQNYTNEGQDAFTTKGSNKWFDKDLRVFPWFGGTASESGICASVVSCFCTYLLSLNPKFI